MCLCVSVCVCVCLCASVDVWCVRGARESTFALCDPPNSYPLTRWLMNDKRSILDWRPLTALGLLAGGIVISLVSKGTPSPSPDGHTSHVHGAWRDQFDYLLPHFECGYYSPWACTRVSLGVCAHMSM